jgi:hypothetical protein
MKLAITPDSKHPIKNLIKVHYTYIVNITMNPFVQLTYANKKKKIFMTSNLEILVLEDLPSRNS